jgi:hypothetical protein
MLIHEMVHAAEGDAHDEAFFNRLVDIAKRGEEWAWNEARDYHPCKVRTSFTSGDDSIRTCAKNWTLGEAAIAKHVMDGKNAAFHPTSHLNSGVLGSRKVHQCNRTQSGSSTAHTNLSRSTSAMYFSVHGSKRAAKQNHFNRDCPIIESSQLGELAADSE